MEYRDGNLQNLKKNVERAAYLESRLKELTKIKKELEPKLVLLEINAQNEGEDVENLEGKTLTSLFYDIVGKKEEKLEKERAEASKSAGERDEVKRELDAVTDEIASCKTELASLVGSAERYANALDEKLEGARNSGVRDADTELACKERILCCEAQLRRINHALIILDNAKDKANKIVRELDDAEGWDEISFVAGAALASAKNDDHTGNAKNFTNAYKKEIANLAECELGIDTDALSQIEMTVDAVNGKIELLSTLTEELFNRKDAIIISIVKLQLCF